MDNKEKLLEWLKTDKTLLCLEQNNNYHYFIKINREPDIDAIFHQYALNSGKICLMPLEYSGIFNHIDNKIYDAKHKLKSICSIDDSPSQEDIIADIAAGVASEVKKRIDTNINNGSLGLKKYELNADEIERVNYTARNLYLKDNKEKTYICNYELRSLRDDNFIRALTEKTELIDELASNYINDHTDRILINLAIDEKINEKLLEYYENPSNPFYNQKQIMCSMSDCESKTVNVTTEINNMQFTFKFSADLLKIGCYSYYDKSKIPAKEREQFNQIYGKNIDFVPDDIIKISNGNKIIYEQTVDMEIEQEMDDEIGLFF